MDMARAADSLPDPSVVFIDDGLTDDERGVALAAWFEGFDRRPKRDIGVRAVDVLDEMRAEGEIL
jgi:hypothetical protein